MNKVSEMMTREVALIDPDKSICDAAKLMAECGAGVIPVGENDRLIGVITDRDIAIRAVANGLSPETTVRQVMSNEVLYCYEDQTVDEVATNMGDQQVRRLPVLNRAKRLVGIVSLGDLAVKVAPKTTGEALADISRPGGARDQTMH
ncbi:CBS domain-containing protein [Usitatibacter palustris]|uniref:Hypoxic response protein 1 n=1 Tax=Usitatibacter palustris TaxID=2732487 RepID=A0A6M4HD71_9PROT|nr:CBS domain-containing protein [Usitatibacter palustris]QJR16668.1 Hypoxic response protein 1 [Usitatibacter palustris]